MNTHYFLLAQAAEPSGLSQPWATVIAALGVILAAAIAAVSQSKTRDDQRQQQKDLLEDARKERDAQAERHENLLRAQREEWKSKLGHEGRRLRLERVLDMYSNLVMQMDVLEKNFREAEREVGQGKPEIANRIATFEREAIARTGLHEKIDGHTVTALESKIRLLGSDGPVPRVEIAAWVDAARRGRPSDEVRRLGDAAVYLMGKHIEILERGD